MISGKGKEGVDVSESLWGGAVELQLWKGELQMQCCGRRLANEVALWMEEK